MDQYQYCCHYQLAILDTIIVLLILEINGNAKYACFGQCPANGNAKYSIHVRVHVPDNVRIWQMIRSGTVTIATIVSF